MKNVYDKSLPSCGHATSATHLPTRQSGTNVTMLSLFVTQTQTFLRHEWASGGGDPVWVDQSGETESRGGKREHQALGMVGQREGQMETTEQSWPNVPVGVESSSTVRWRSVISSCVERGGND